MNKLAGGVGFLPVRMIYLVRTRTNEKMHYFVFCFLLDFSIPPRSGGLRNTIFVFSWSQLDAIEE